MHATDALAEADRLMTVCNSCRYCEGLCAVFPAMETRRDFLDGDLNYLANLCHSCGACYYDCQFSPPHEFNVNVPKILGLVRADSYGAYAWPSLCSGLFRRNGLAIGVIAAASVIGFVVAIAGLADPAVLFARQEGAGAFYRIMPHHWMAALFGAAFVFAMVAMAMGVRRFWQDIGEPAQTLTMPRPLWQAIKDAASLRYLDGGGVGCMNEGERPTDRRRSFHHMTSYGFMLCLASTIVATLYHYLLGREAPYPLYDLPVVLGTLGGIGMVIGPIGLLIAKMRRDPVLEDKASSGMGVAFIAMVLLTSVTGLALLVLRGTSLMGLALPIHLGFVFAFFVTMPYGKFVHGIYRFLALVRYARERQDER